MIVTPFGDIRYNDQDALRHWQAAHGVRHRTYAQVLLRQGINTQSPPLLDQTDRNFLMMHYLAHVVLAKQLAPDTTSQSHGLMADFMSDERQFYNWHRTHNLVHQRLDQTLGVVNR